MSVEVKNVKRKRKFLLLRLYINKIIGKTEKNSLVIKESGLFKQYGGGTGIRLGFLQIRILLV